MHIKTFEVRWDEVDPNQHMRHTVYLTFGAQARVELFNRNGIEFTGTGLPDVAPVLFREEAIYRREIRFGQVVEVRTRVTALSDDAGRWSIRHEVMRPDGELAATIEADGAWINMQTRKLAVPPVNVAEAFRELFKHDS
jgi:acyl-CoA thioester hydrolase